MLSHRQHLQEPIAREGVERLICSRETADRRPAKPVQKSSERPNRSINGRAYLPDHRRRRFHRPPSRRGTRSTRRQGPDPRQPRRAGPRAGCEGAGRAGSGAEFRRGDIRDAEAVRAALRGVDGVFHLAAEVGVGQSMYEIDRYTSVNDLGTAVLFQQLIEQPVRRVVVASSMSVYGEGLYINDNGERIDVPERRGRAIGAGMGSGGRATGGRSCPCRRRRARRRRWPRSMRSASSCRSGCALMVAGAYRHGVLRAAALQRLRAGTGAVEPLYRRAGDLRLAAGERAAADGLRGWRAAARLRACRGRRARLPPGAWSGPRRMAR